MRRFCLVVAYDGTDFHGWQRQPGSRTVQGVLEEGVGAVMGGAVKLEGAGRTDAGVHARGQVASFGWATRLPARALPPLLNRVLPRDLRVVSARETGPEFHARRSATARRYAYRLLSREDLLFGRFAFRPLRPWSADGVSRAVRPLEGCHDCAAFQAAGSGPVRTLCRIHRATWSVWEGGLRFEVVADHFLYRMVRTIVGTALALSTGPRPEAAMAVVLASRDRRRAGPPAPAHGLTLEQVFYPAGGAP
ncbi:MAG: tRNA pseudouridine(38-40) synthase TruA [Candidatus Eisenbacteria bacterium RBG_16_71_46]|nr:MAG: tRNA pseudouridine(38-40) synthase TruA [Candidatus Eisenbacteria bacterium RBG_16_71_46]